MSERTRTVRSRQGNECCKGGEFDLLVIHVRDLDQTSRFEEIQFDDAEDEEQVDSIMDANAQLERMYRDRGKSVVFSKGALFWNEMNPLPDRLSDEEVEKNTFDDSPPPMPGFCVLFQPMTKEITVRIVSVSFSDGSLPKIFVSEVRSTLKDEAEKWYHIACTFSEQTRT